MRVEQFRARRPDLRNGPPRRAWQAGRQDGGTPPRCPRGRASRGVDLVVGGEHARLRNAARACTSACARAWSVEREPEAPQPAGCLLTPARPCHLAWQDARQALRRAHLSAHRRSAQAHPPAIADAPRQAPGDTPRPVPHRSRDVALSGHAIGTGAAMPTPQATPVSCLPSSTAIYTSLATCRRANDNDTGCSVFSAERIGDPDAAIVLAVVEVFGQDLRAAHRAGCLDDRGVPV